MESQLLVLHSYGMNVKQLVVLKTTAHNITAKMSRIGCYLEIL